MDGGDQQLEILEARQRPESLQLLPGIENSTTLLPTLETTQRQTDVLVS